MVESNTHDDEVSDTFLDIECDDAVVTKMSLLLKITQPGQRPLPIGVVTERSIIALIKRVTNYTPLGITIMNDVDVVVEFGRGVRLYEAAQLLHSLASWDQYKIEIGTIISSKPQIIDMVRERERVREADRRIQQQQQELVEEETKHRVEIQDLLERFEEQIKRIELTHSKISSLSGPTNPGTVDTPLHETEYPLSPRSKVFKQLSLPRFSGSLPVPKGEGSYEQYMFQIKGFRATYTDEAIKSGMIGSITDDARDYLDFIGFDKELPVLIEALEQRYGQGQSADKLQQDFYQLSQERNEQIQQFAGRLEFKYKKLVVLYPDRYTPHILKERLFYGMTQHLRNSMRYLFKPETTYEELLMSAKEAEAEWLENKTMRAKATSTSLPDPGKKERDELKQRIQELAAELARKEKEGQGNQQWR